MRERLENALWRAMYVINERILKDEEGDSNMVAVIVLIVIILAIGALFQKQLREAVDAVFGNLMEFIG